MGHISCPVCDHGSFVDLKLFKKCVESALSRPMCCLICNQTVLGLPSLHVHLSQHEFGSQATTPSDESKRETDLRIVGSTDSNSPQSDDCALPEAPLGNLYLSRSIGSSIESNIQEFQSNETIPPLDKLDLEDDPMLHDVTKKSDGEPCAGKFASSSSNDLRPSNKCSLSDLQIAEQTNSPSNSSQYSCDECGLMFSTEHFLAWHKDIIHKRSDCFEVSCKLCKMKFPSLETYRNHVRENHNEQRYLCEKCPKTFKLIGSLVVHKRMCHDGTPSICQLCHKKFPSDTRRDLHERRHHASGGKAISKGKFSQDLEPNSPLKKTLQTNNIQKACRNLDNLIQKNICQPNCFEVCQSNSSSMSTTTVPALSVSTVANSQISFSEIPKSLQVGNPSTSQKENNFKGETALEKTDAVIDSHVLITSLEASSGKSSPVTQLALRSSKSRLYSCDTHASERLQNEGTALEVPRSSSNKSHDVLQQMSEPRCSEEKMSSPTVMTAGARNTVLQPHCPKTVVRDLNSSVTSPYQALSQIDENLSSDLDEVNSSEGTNANENNMEFYSSSTNSHPGTQYPMTKIHFKSQSHGLPTAPPKNMVGCCKLNDSLSTDIKNNESSAAVSSDLKNMKKNFSETHQNQKVGLPAFLGCDGKPWECDVCKKCFTTKYFLKKHKRLHTGETPYMCSECGKTFTFQQSYHKHLLYHSDDKPHVCSHCGRAFKEMSTLHNHVRIHTGEKPFVCETCGKAFRQRVSYLVHQRIHNGVLPYTCQECQKSFRYKVSLRSHKCERAGKDSPATSTNSPSKTTRSESKDLSLTSTNTDPGEIIGENEPNFSHTQLGSALEENPSNTFGLALTAQLENDCVAQNDRLINPLKILTSKCENSDPIQLMSNTAQSHSIQNVTATSVSTPLSHSFLTCSNTNVIFRHAVPSNFNASHVPQNNERSENDTPCQIFKLSSNSAMEIEDFQGFSDKNTTLPSHNLPIGPNDHNPVQNSSFRNQEWQSRCGKDIDVFGSNFEKEYNNYTCIPMAANESLINEIFVNSNSSNIEESYEKFPSANSEETTEYPVLLTLSSQASDSEEDMDGEAIFRRLFS